MTIQQVMAESGIVMNTSYGRAKRFLDVLFTLIILPPLCLIMIVVAIAIRLDSDGPIFYRQKRIGQHGHPFEMLKFRTMYHRCDDQLHRQAIERYMADQPINEQGLDETPHYKLAHDPRITRVGRLLRKTCIDELPQFFNVLRGDMALVGPRPPLDYEVARYSPRDMLRLYGKPGLTGTWQVYGKGRVPFSTMVDMDLAYLQQQSLWLDLKLIFLTIPVMLRGGGDA